MGPEVEYADNARLTELLRSVVRPGDYCAHGRLFLPMPTVNVAGVGLLSFPVPDSQVRALTEVAERAPYGRGTETLVDTSVRDCWQIDAARLCIAGRAWDDTFATVLDAVATGLGFGDDLEARLYKLLVYPTGGFFAPHRDTEKVDGMVATLTISLPTAGAGGELVVRHADREEVIDMNAVEPSELAFAAFYADCSHETRPVRDGHRLSLVYNLCVLPGDTETPRHAPDYSAEAEAAARHLVEWQDEGAGKLVWLLEHDYTAAGLSFDTLKNADNAVAHVLAAATARTDCALHAAIVHIEETGSARYGEDDYVESWHWRESDIEAMEIGDLYSSRHWLDGWVGTDGSRPPFDEIPLLPEELLPTGALDGAEPDARRVHEASGNEGDSMDDALTAASLLEDHPQVLTPDRAVPVVLEGLRGEAGLPETSAFATLWRHAADFLLARSATPPEAPKDWVVATDILCSCEHCARLRSFCADPVARVARFPLRQELRKHLHRIIDEHRLDMSHETERRGRPFTLVCTKNRATHKRRLAEYAEDIARMSSLMASAPFGQQAELCRAQMAALRDATFASGG